MYALTVRGLFQGNTLWKIINTFILGIPYICNKCGQAFAWKDHLHRQEDHLHRKDHLHETIHNKSKVCDTCGLEFLINISFMEYVKCHMSETEIKEEVSKTSEIMTL